jgi:hypothetical protein
MGWWGTGEKGEERIGDEPADAVTVLLAKLPSLRTKKHQPLPHLQELLDCLASALRSKGIGHPDGFHGLRARLSNGVELVSNSGCNEGRAVIDAVKDTLVEIDQIYHEAFERSPTLREIVDNFAFVLGHVPSRYLSGVEQLEITDIRLLVA